MTASPRVGPGPAGTDLRALDLDRYRRAVPRAAPPRASRVRRRPRQRAHTQRTPPAQSGRDSAARAMSASGGAVLRRPWRPSTGSSRGGHDEKSAVSRPRADIPRARAVRVRWSSRALLRADTRYAATRRPPRRRHLRGNVLPLAPAQADVMHGEACSLVAARLDTQDRLRKSGWLSQQRDANRLGRSLLLASAHIVDEEGTAAQSHHEHVARRAAMGNRQVIPGFDRARRGAGMTSLHRALILVPAEGEGNLFGHQGRHDQPALAHHACASASLVPRSKGDCWCAVPDQPPMGEPAESALGLPNV